MVINTDIASMTGRNALRTADLDFRTRMQRLSSGLRINQGADDPSGLAISEGMRAQIRGLDASIHNLQDTVNMLQTVDGAAAELQDMVQRMRDLSVRAANEATLTARDRSNIQNEIQSLASAMRQVAFNLKFNGKDLNGEQKIAFQSERTGDSEIFIMDANGNAPANLTNMAGNQRNAVPSPDGSFIAFDSFQANWEVTVIPAQGGAPINLTNHPQEDIWKSWSPDGERLLFRSFRDGNYELYAVERDGSNLVNLTNNPGTDTVPAVWSPDGTRIAFVSQRDGNQELYVVDSDGANLTNLTQHPGEDFWPEWSPDGSKIAFLSTRSGNYELYVINEDGSGLVNVSNSLAADMQPAWSPDSSQLAFASPRSGFWNVYVVNADGSGLEMVTDNTGLLLYPFWSPDGKSIGYTSLRTGDWEIYSIDIGSGQPAVNLTNSPGYDFALTNGWHLGTLELNVQAGPDSSHHFELELRPLSPRSLGVAGLRVDTAKRAGRAIELCDHALNALGDYRAEIGIMSRRAGHVIDDNIAARINESAARSRIADADMAAESAAYARAAIVRRSAEGMIANEQSLRRAAFDLLFESLK